MIVVGLSYGLIDFGTANTIITCRVSKDAYGAFQLLNFSIASIVGLAFFILALLTPETYRYSDDFFDALLLTLPVFMIYSCTIVPYARLHKALRLIELSMVDFLPVLSMLLAVPLFLHLKFGLLTLPASMSIQVLLRFLVLTVFYGNILRFNFRKIVLIKVLARQYCYFSQFTLPANWIKLW